MSDPAGEAAKTKRKLFRMPGGNRTSRKGTTQTPKPPNPERNKPPSAPSVPERRIYPSRKTKDQPQTARVEASRSSSSSDDYIHVKPEREDNLLVHPPSMQTMKRVSIHRKRPSLASHQSTPITKHYEVAKQILSTYDSHYSSNLWVTAYAFGMQFVELALLELPKHGYYFSDRHERERMENSLEAARVSHELLQLPEADKDHLQKLLTLAHDQIEQASSDQERQLSYEHRRAEVEEQSVYDADWVLCEPSTILSSCSESFAMGFSFVGGGNNGGEALTEPPTQDWTMDASDSKDMDESSSAALNKALFLSGIEFAKNEIRDDPPGLTLERSSSQLEIATLATVRHRDVDDLLANGRVKLLLVDTFQGKVPGSTNGCAVIAPLLCSKYIANTKDTALSGDDITKTIDVEAPSVLRDLRAQLGIPDQAFLIPSDANDYLLDKGLFKQDQFVTVAGGNLLDEEHVNAFLKALEGETSRLKLASTLFFHEHVFAILKVPIRRSANGRVYYRYDLLDSLPLKDTVCYSDETREEMCQRLGVFNGMTEEEKTLERDINVLPRTACFRCRDTDSLMGVLWWYACSKFTEENMKYIDHIPWDDAANDFDPRVFQAFIVRMSSSSPINVSHLVAVGE